MNLHLLRCMGMFALMLLIGSLFEVHTGAALAQSPNLTYPPAKRADHVDTYHGVRVADPYHWMEDMKADETQTWVRAQDALTHNFMGQNPSFEAFYNRIYELWNFDLYTIPSKQNGRYFYTKTDAGKNQAVLYVQEGLNVEARVLLDPLVHYDDDALNIASFWPSPDGQRVAYLLTKDQSRWGRLEIVDVERGVVLSDMLTGLNTLGGNMAWLPDGQAFYYVRFDIPEEGTELQAAVENPRVYYHRVGTKQSGDVLVYERRDKKNWLFGIQVTDDGHYLIITMFEGGGAKNQIFYRDLRTAGGDVIPLLDQTDATYTFLGNEGSFFWFYTNLNAPRGRIIALDLDKQQPERLTEVIPEAKETIAGGSLAGGNALGLFGNRFVLMYNQDVLPLVKVFDLQGQVLYEVDLPGTGSIWGGFSGRQQDSEVFYQFLGLAHPSSIFRLDLDTGESTIFRQSELRNFNPNDYESKQIFYRSKDGTQVPMFISHKKGLALDGNNPTFMYAYGALGWTQFLWYQPHIITWMEMGGVYAFPGIRGGGEYGEAWHKAGSGLNKQNSIDDYLAAAKWLIENNYTSPSKLVANGGSLSGPLVGAAIIQRPDLFGASIIDRPALDMLRYDKFTGAGYWIEELGAPDDPEAFEVLYSYSPYHNIVSDQCYPPTMIMIGNLDETTPPLHAYKFTAALQAAQGCNHPVLLKMMWGVGHNFAMATPDQMADAWANAWSFLARVLSLNTDE